MRTRLTIAVTAFILTLGVVFSGIAQAASDVALLRIVSYGPGGTGGHSFIMVKNLSGSNLTVGTYSISPSQTVSVGTWGNKPDGKGVYYNLELYFASKDSSAYKGRVSLSDYITAAQLSTISTKIKSRNTWSYTNNCSSFAKDVWNSVASASWDVSAGTPNTPTKLASSIRTKGVWGIDVTLPPAGSSSVKRLSGGTNKSVSSGTLSGSSNSF